jgi:hypothetical protein
MDHEFEAKSFKVATWSAKGLLDAAADRGRDTKKMEPALSRSSGARRDY